MLKAINDWARVTFQRDSACQRAAQVLSHQLLGVGIQRGVRVATVLPQRFETTVAARALHFCRLIKAYGGRASPEAASTLVASHGVARTFFSLSRSRRW